MYFSQFFIIFDKFTEWLDRRTFLHHATHAQWNWSQHERRLVTSVLARSVYLSSCYNSPVRYVCFFYLVFLYFKQIFAGVFCIFFPTNSVRFILLYHSVSFNRNPWSQTKRVRYKELLVIAEHDIKNYRFSFSIIWKIIGWNIVWYEQLLVEI